MAAPLAKPPFSLRDSATEISKDGLKSSTFNPEYLRKQVRWIRDTLDPQVAQEGPDVLHSDDCLNLDDFLRQLLDDSQISLENIRYSRLHLAVSDIAGLATRWPKRLIDRCETIKDKWEAQFGPLNILGTPLYEAGGRLNGICKPEDLSKDKLLVKWLRSSGSKLSPSVSRKSGSLGFTPGDWWISPLFAHRAGIIDAATSDGTVVADQEGAYAVVMTDNDEVFGSDPEVFQYRARDRDPGRYRLTAGTPESRHPIRILRSHSLHSFWKPRAGIRYDGLHKVTGWTVKRDPKTGKIVYLIDFKRLATELGMDQVLSRPYIDEIEDYTEYKRLRRVFREKQKEKEAPKPAFQLSGDGFFDVYQDETAQVPFQEKFTDRLPDKSKPLPEQIMESSVNQRRGLSGRHPLGGDLSGL